MVILQHNSKTYPSNIQFRLFVNIGIRVICGNKQLIYSASIHYEQIATLATYKVELLRSTLGLPPHQPSKKKKGDSARDRSHFLVCGSECHHTSSRLARQPKRFIKRHNCIKLAKKSVDSLVKVGEKALLH